MLSLTPRRVMNTCLRQKSLHAALALLAGIVAMAGCISFDSKDMQWAMGQTVLLPANTIVKIAGASEVYRQCSGRWPVSLEELRLSNCSDADKREQISNYLADIQWDAITNAVFKTSSEGKLTISLSFAPKTASTNGTSITWGGGQVTAENIQYLDH